MTTSHLSPVAGTVPLKFPTRSPITVAEHDGNTSGDNMWDDLIDGFCTSLEASGRNYGTVRNRRHYATNLAKSFADPLTITRRDIENWLTSKTWVPNTRKSAMDAINGFYDWVVDAGYLERSPTRSIAPVRIPRARAKPAPEHVYQATMARSDYRTRIMVALARHAGLRCVEISRVRGDHLQPDGTLRVVGKGDHERFVPILDEDLLAILRATPGHLFPSQRSDHLTAGHVSRLLSRAMTDGYTGHAFRHAFGTTSHRANPDLLALAEVMGHESLNTTRRYVQLDRPALDRVVAGARPGAARILPTAWERMAA